MHGKFESSPLLWRFSFGVRSIFFFSIFSVVRIFSRLRWKFSGGFSVSLSYFFFFHFPLGGLANYASFLSYYYFVTFFFDILIESFFSRLTLSPFFFPFYTNLMLYFVKRKLFSGNFLLILVICSSLIV